MSDIDTGWQQLQEHNEGGVWSGDTGALPEASRRALLQLLRGPLLSQALHPQLWGALLADEAAIRSRLHELFLDLAIDPGSEVAYIRNAETFDVAVPSTVRSASLTFLDTAMLLVLRQHLVSADGSERVIVGRDDVFEQLAVYRDAGRDESDWARRLNASWGKLGKYGIISKASEDERVEISPVLRLVFGPEQITGLRDEYRRIAERGGGGSTDSTSEENE
ncbi:DUF4194 domain-containing protein [Microbacteriaceae bacterium VKM Ac-2855]|nr:DUF4194 domain-containing protein [Microbacteriaceae bacterium VKM Ac-2855]